MKKSIILSICFFLFFILQLQQTLRTCEFEVLFRGKNNIPKENIYLKEIMSIGNKEGNENHMFFSPRSVQVNDSGDIFVLDANNYRVQKYDKEGKYVLTIGRKGRGPGELLGCQNMDLDSQGNLVLFDFENSRVSIFSPDGKYIRTIKLGFPPIKGTVDSDNNIYIYYRHNLKLIHKYDPEGNHVTSFMDELEVDHPRLITNINVSGQIAAFKDKIFLLLPYPYAIRIFSTNGNKLNTISIKGDYPKQPFVAPDGTVIMNFCFTGLAISPDMHIYNVGISFEIPKGWKDKINEILAEYYSNSFMDVFTLDGERVGYMKCPGLVWGGCFDSKGFYYAIKEDDSGYCRIVKNKMFVIPP